MEECHHDLTTGTDGFPFGVTRTGSLPKITPTRLIVALLALVSVLSVSACGGGGAKSETAVTNTTVSKGQQLIDLKAALDAGSISEEEYEKERKKILDE